ncbi:MAG: hypothetical protein OEZ21_08375 [Candidatus Bathyarchaeota archaeon]|nr:hypothetical protein [Candidatus Bathyarchaeota archaeon]MDH5746952.1 hypothetical protein [Candidatus Bathyarchaeota archaeon]
MRIILAIKADALKLAQLLSKFSKDYRITYTLTKQNGEYLMEVNTDNFGELVRRLNHLKGCTFQVKEMHGGRLLDKLNVKLTKTNVDALIDKTTVTKTDIDPVDGGVIKLMGELWFCRPANDKSIKEGAKVKVVGVEGVSLIVEEVR